MRGRGVLRILINSLRAPYADTAPRRYGASFRIQYKAAGQRGRIPNGESAPQNHADTIIYKSSIGMRVNRIPYILYLPEPAGIRSRSNRGRGVPVRTLLRQIERMFVINTRAKAFPEPISPEIRISSQAYAATKAAIKNELVSFARKKLP